MYSSCTQFTAGIKVQRNACVPAPSTMQLGERDNCGSASRLYVVDRFGNIIQKNLHKLTITATLYYLGVNMSRPRSPFGLRSSWSSLKRVRKHGYMMIELQKWCCDITSNNLKAWRFCLTITTHTNDLTSHANTILPIFPRSL